MDVEKRPYGFELIMDLHNCNVSKFNRESLKNYFIKLCKAIDMKREKSYFWDDEGLPEEQRQISPHTKGTSAVQFILTSSIVIHALDLLKAVYINIFSCKKFDEKIAEEITKKWFEAEKCNSHLIGRI